MRLQGILAFLLLFAILTIPASAAVTTAFGANDSIIVNRTDVMSDSKAVPISIWLLAIAISVILVVVSFLRFPVGEEVLVAIMAIPPAWYAYITAYNVDQIAVAGIATVSGGYQIIEKHTIYHFDDLALFILLPFAVCTMINAFRIYSNYRQIKQAARFEETTDTNNGMEDLNQ